MKLFLRFFIILSCICVSCGRSQEITDRGEWIPLDSVINYDAGYFIYKNEICEMCEDHYNINSRYSSLLDILNYYYSFELDDRHFLFIDTNTFRFCKNSSYAKDAKHVYYSICVYYFNSDTNGLSAASEMGDILFGADSGTFKYLGDGYAVDCQNMYLNGKKIDWNDSIVARYQ